MAAPALRSAYAGSKLVPASFVATKFHLGTDFEVHLPAIKQREAEQGPAAPGHVGKAPASGAQGFDGLWGVELAERLGAHFLPVLEAARAEQQSAKRRQRAASAAQPAVPTIPHLLPLTRWAAQQETVRSTLIADDPATRRPARLSWYHPDDGMVPRGWFAQGLLKDLAYYRPFGWGKAAS